MHAHQQIFGLNVLRCVFSPFIWLPKVLLIFEDFGKQWNAEVGGFDSRSYASRSCSCPEITDRYASKRKEQPLSWDIQASFHKCHASFRIHWGYHNWKVAWCILVPLHMPHALLLLRKYFYLLLEASSQNLISVSLNLNGDVLSKWWCGWWWGRWWTWISWPSLSCTTWYDCWAYDCRAYGR